METVTNDSWISIPNLYDLAYRAHSNISFSPEKRAYKIVANYEGQLNDDLKNIPETERERYIEGYVKRLSSWLSAKSNCLSSMIAGPSNFPVRRAERANRTEENRYNDFSEWRDKALRIIARREEDAKPEEQKNAERWAHIKGRLESSMRTIVEIDNGINTFSARPLFVSSIAGTIKTLAKNADAEMVQRSLNLIKEWNGKYPKPIITEKNSIWKLLDECEINREKEADRQTTESSEYEINGVKVVKNFQAERIQLFFDGKPAPDVIYSLKHNAFKWSPSNMCWQRQLTQNAINATNGLLKSLA